MIVVKLLVRLIGALIISALIALYILQYNERFKAHIHMVCIQEYEKQFNCCVHAKLTGLSLINPTIMLEDVTVTDKEKTGWSWHCKQVMCSISWPYLIMQYPFIPLDIALTELAITTDRRDGKTAIHDHIMYMFEAPADAPILLHSLTIRKALLTITDYDNNMITTIPYACQVGLFDNTIKTTCSINQAFITYNQMRVCSGIDASIQTVTDLAQNAPITQAYAQATCNVHQSADTTLLCYVNGTWDGNHGRIHLTSENKQISLMYDIVTKQNEEQNRYTWHARASAPLSLCKQYSPYLETGIITGTAQILVHHHQDAGKPDSDETYGHVTLVDNATYGTISTHFKQTGTVLEGIVTSHDPLIGGFSGTWDFDLHSWNCNASLTNRAQIHVWPSKYWSVAPGGCAISTTTADDGIHVKLSSNQEHALTHEKQTSTAALTVTPHSCSVQATHEQHTLEAICDLTPTCKLRSAEIYDAQGRSVFTCGQAEPGATYTGVLMFPLLKQIINAASHNSLSGKGDCHLTLDTSNGLQASLMCKDASIRVMNMYNIITAAHASVTLDPTSRMLMLKQGVIGFHKGNIVTNQATIHYDQETLQPTFVHAPLLIDNVLLTAEKEVFIVVSGSLILLKNPSTPTTLRGSLVLERGQIKKNIFATALTKNVVSSVADSYGPAADACALDLKIQAHKPLHVKTPFLEAYIKPDLEIKGTVEHPRISGSISITEGTLAFPYKPMYITHAQLHFIPEHLYDPRIEFVAKGKIKKYNVTMRISGSLERPTISFESTPKLAEEKIITLILAGSEEGSFPMVMPTLIMHNVQQLLFGPEPTESTLERTFKTILAPLKGISIVPSFDDQSGRGGLRGAIEIGVNERLSGKIQKNFSLTEDTKFEVEYLLSDDMSIRGTKDERGDIGGELEMRWKF